MSDAADRSIRDGAVAMMDARHVMAIATVRPDGWPHNTIVGYANEGTTVYFLIFRSSQKYDNIAHDGRVAIAIGEQPANIHFAEAVYAAGHASEVTDPQDRAKAWQMLVTRHPNLAGRGMPDPAVAAIMCARFEHLSVLDYAKGLGHSDALDLPQA